MPELKTLIDRASEVCGGDAKLARRMGVSQSVISDMRHRGRSISPVTAAELADIAGEDAREAAIAAVIESTKGTRREGAMREILGKALAVGVAGMLVFSYSGDSISSTEKPTTTANNCNSLYIVSTWVRRVLRRWMRELLSGIPHQNVPEILRQAPPVVIDAG